MERLIAVVEGNHNLGLVETAGEQAPESLAAHVGAAGHGCSWPQSEAANNAKDNPVYPSRTSGAHDGQRDSADQ
ncbi:hypothetical protein GCM10009848_43160 [Micromonospora lupini]|uniref:Uncharacterized protein n=1 Tax=Micromonospora lupini str. Lupac 08 TaxID=1150864 RepID=I0L5E2_9ACTN|nr:Protein of unknown function [Micromonospora lupini str. Lupac 08]